MRWLLLLVSIALSLVMAECVARVVDDEAYLQRRLRAGGVLVPYEPGARAELLTDEFRVGYEINRFGHRDRLDRRSERTPGVPRIVLLGDSFAAGWGVEREESFGARLERRTGIEVVNAAKNGGCPLWYVPQARYLSATFSPDWLLVQLFDNDPQDDFDSAEDFEIEPGEPFEELPAAIRPITTPARHLSHLYERSVLRRRIRQLSRRLRGEAMHGTPYVAPGAQPDRPTLSREEVVAKHGLDLSPSRPFHEAMDFHDPARWDAWRERLDWSAALVDQLVREAADTGVPVALLYVPAAEVLMRPPAPNPFADRLREVARRRGALWLDASRALRDHPRPWELYYAYDGHLDPEGHAAVADLLVRELAPRVEVALPVPR